jgi:hypothetical protein
MQKKTEEAGQTEVEKKRCGWRSKTDKNMMKEIE